MIEYYSKILSTTLYLYTPIHMYYNAEELMALFNEHCKALFYSYVQCR